jgi:hypothetical protein
MRKGADKPRGEGAMIMADAEIAKQSCDAL